MNSPRPKKVTCNIICFFPFNLFFQFRNQDKNTHTGFSHLHQSQAAFWSKHHCAVWAVSITDHSIYKWVTERYHYLSSNTFNHSVSYCILGNVAVSTERESRGLALEKNMKLVTLHNAHNFHRAQANSSKAPDSISKPEWRWEAQIKMFFCAVRNAAVLLTWESWENQSQNLVFDKCVFNIYIMIL